MAVTSGSFRRSEEVSGDRWKFPVIGGGRWWLAAAVNGGGSNSQWCKVVVVVNGEKISIIKKLQQ